MLIQILIDNPDSWIVPYAVKLNEQLSAMNFVSRLLFEHEKVEEGDILIMLSCEKIFRRLELNKHNLVVHESALPEGKGWSPLTWQILEGKNEITMTLFEAAEKVDSGYIYEQLLVKFDGLELNQELKHKQGIATIDLILHFCTKYPNVNGQEQKGKESFYPRRRADDSELDINRTIAEQFNLLRIVDNERYPAFFIKDGIKYLIKIEKEGTNIIKKK